MYKIIGSILILVGLMFISTSLVPYVSNDDYQNNQETAVREYRIEEGQQIEHKNTKAILTIPAFGKNYEMPVVDSVDQDVLDSGVVGHFPETAAVGKRGNYSLTAHRITHGEPFRNLPELDLGDEVIIEKDGATYVYKITKEPFDIHYTDVWVLNPHGSQKTITLITCASLAPTEDRTVVVGKLVRKG